MATSVATWLALGGTAATTPLRLQQREHLEWDLDLLIALRPCSTQRLRTRMGRIQTDGKASKPFFMHRWSKLFIPTLRDRKSVV